MKRLLPLAAYAVTTLCTLCFSNHANAAFVTVATGASVEIVDKQNKLIGVAQQSVTTLTGGKVLAVILKIKGQFYSIHVDVSGFQDSYDTKFFATQDCTGSPYRAYFDGNPNPHLLNTNHTEIDGVVWDGDPANVTTAVNIQSSRLPLSDICTNDNLPAPGSPVIPLTELVDLNTIFKPPFRLRLRETLKNSASIGGARIVQ